MYLPTAIPVKTFDGMYSKGLHGSSLGPSCGSQKRCIFADANDVRQERVRTKERNATALGDLDMVVRKRDGG